jgi:hypothetical protein
VEAVTDRSWLLECCRKGFLTTELPWRVEWKGSTWDCASNGHAIVFLRGATVDAREGAPPLDRGMNPEPARWHTVSFSALRAWAECSLMRVQCSTCRGRCQLFGMPCDWCDGEGAYDPEALPGIFFGRPVNRRLLWRFIRRLTNDNADLCNVGLVDDGDGQVWITTGSWIVVLMPMAHTTQDDCECQPFPPASESAA